MCGKIFAILIVVGVVSAQNGNEQVSAEAQSIPPDVSVFQRDINQWNIIQQTGHQTAPPGFVWIQVPVTNLHQQQEAASGAADVVQSVGQGIPPVFATGEGGPASPQGIPPVYATGEETPASPQGIPSAFETGEQAPASLQGPAAPVQSESGLDGRCLLPRGQFPSTVCNRFVNCWDGTATEQECPGGLLFSSDKGYCDFAERVECGGRPIIEGPPPPSSSSGDVTAPPPPSAGQSSSGAASSQQAVPTTPSPQITPIAATLPPVDPELKKHCLQPRGQFASGACNKFVNCWDGNVIEQECPEGLLFSAKGYCDYAVNVNCGDRSSSFENKITDIKECPLESGTFREKKNCGSYYTCIGYKIVARYECPEGFIYSDHIGVCDYEDRVDCTKEPLIYQRKINTDSVLEYEGTTEHNFSVIDAECPVEFGTYRDKSNCASYYTCISYKIVAKHDCPSGFLYNDELGICDYSDRVDCTKASEGFQRKSNFIPQLPTAYMDKVKSCTPGTVLRLNPQCSAACLCRDGVAEIVQCPAGTAYDSSSDKCVSPHLARC